MDIHPIIVHFPIALLSFYAALELIRLPILVRQQWWFPVKAVLLIAGFVGVFLALQTGEIAEESAFATGQRDLVELHSSFATAATLVFGALVAIYLLQWISQGALAARFPLIVRLARSLFRSPILIVGSLAGLIVITITGALGGAIVYGPDADPIVSIIYHLFVAQ